MADKLSMEHNAIKNVTDLKVYLLTNRLTKEVFHLTKKIPGEDYSLIYKLRRSSLSVTKSIKDGFAKRKYENVFIRHLVESIVYSEEMRGWLEFSRDCNYITMEEFNSFDSRYREVEAMLNSLINELRTS